MNEGSKEEDIKTTEEIGSGMKEYWKPNKRERDRERERERQ